MFLNYNEVSYKDIGEKIPESVSFIQYTSPTLEVQGVKSGAAVVASLINSLEYLYKGEFKVSDECINNLYQKAIELDDVNDIGDSDYPSLKSMMESAIQLGYVKNASVGFLDTVEKVKNYIRNYKCLIVELKCSDSILNTMEYNITSSGVIETDDFTKGFVAYAYDTQGIFVQNTRGLNCGNLGFHNISWSAFSELFVKAALFSN